MRPDPGLLGGHLADIVGPKAERICPCITIGFGGEAIAACLYLDVEGVPIGVHRAPQPVFHAIDREQLSPCAIRGSGAAVRGGYKRQNASQIG